MIAKIISKVLVSGTHSNQAPEGSPTSGRHLTIGLRLMIGSGIVIALVLLMALSTIWTTRQISSANAGVSEVFERSSRLQKDSSQMSTWLGGIARAQADLNMILRRMVDDVISNHPRIRGFDAENGDPLGTFLQGNAPDEMVAFSPILGDAVAELAEKHTALLEASQQVQETWQPSHAGLAQKLDGLKRELISWNLKLTNTIFIRSSMGELLYEELGDTPLEEFRNSEIYQSLAGDFPVLKENMENAFAMNEKLYQASDKLYNLMLFGKWDQVRKFYRDNFPTAIKSIIVDIDTILSIENQSLLAQQKVMEIMNGQLKVLSDDISEKLAGIRNSLQGAVDEQQQGLNAVASEVGEKRAAMAGALGTMQLLNLIAPAFVITVMILGGMAMSRSVVRPIKEVVINLREVADGGGDLTRELSVRSGDEVGQLAHNFNRFLRRQRESVAKILGVSQSLKRATDQIRTATEDVKKGAISQSEALTSSQEALQGVSRDINGIAESTATLVDSSRQSTSATLELGATIQEIAEQMDHMFSIVEQVSSSAAQMSAASGQIDANVQNLSGLTQSTASSIQQMDSNIGAIEENAINCGRLAETALQDVDEGRMAVQESVAGIGELSQTVSEAEMVINELGESSRQVESILEVIDEVADQTSLLALNATIIAAQAGERGKAFAVVADEIRNLAERTAASTKEIAQIINKFKGDSTQAVKVMKVGRQRADEEVARSRKAEAALEKIRTSTESSRQQVRAIEKFTHEQTAGSRNITESVGKVTAMLAQIASAVRQLATGINQTAEFSEDLKNLAGRVKSSTEEQAAGSRHINENMETVRNMIDRIDEATRDQSENTGQVVAAMGGVNEVAELTASQSEELDAIVRQLAEHAAILQKEVGVFKIEKETGKHGSPIEKESSGAGHVRHLRKVV